MLNKLSITILILILFLSFITYCFYPIITFNENNKKVPWRILLYDRNGILITDKANENWYKEKNKNYKFDTEIIKSIIKIEDKNYFNHYWFDIVSKIRAIKNNIMNWKIVSGWSTITEQYIKNKYFNENKRTFLQKLREIFLSVYFTIKENKEFILNEYLNNTYFWNNIYWLKWALNVYFNKDNLEILTSEEISIIISLIHNPWIKSLEEKNFRTYFDKVKDKLDFEFERTIYKLNTKKNIDKFPFVTIWKYTSIDSELQNYTKEILNKTLDELASKNVTNWAVFAIIPSTGEILIYQWSREFYSNKIDWQVDVIKSKRQSWSTMKPFLYLFALESWANPDDLIVDLESEYNSFKEWKTYISTNYSLREFWLIRLKKALWNSLNNATVRLARELWLQEVYNFYIKYWFKLEHYPEYYGYSLVLWNPSITLEDLVYNYVKLIPKNTLNPSYHGKITYSSPDKGGKNKEKWELNKFLLYDILSDPDNRDLSFWVNSILNTSIYQAVKTGTSSDFRDNLVVSYHPDLVVWVWIWNNDNSSMIWVTWITWAWYIWHQIIEKAIELWYIKEKNIETPEWIEQWDYCLDEKCFRKEIIYKKNWKEYLSRLAEKKYIGKDLFLKLSSSEKERLEDFWMYLDK